MLTLVTNHGCITSAGSADLWVPSKSCTTDDCADKSKFDPSASSSNKQQPGNFSINYADGSNVQGDIFTDTGMSHCSCCLS